MRLDIQGRAILVVVAFAVAVTPAPTFVRTTTAALTAIVVIEFVMRSRRGGGLDAVLVGLAAALIAVVATGFALDALPGGLTPRSWAAGVGVVELIALAVQSRTPAPRPPSIGGVRWRAVGWYGVAVAVVVASLVVVVRSANHADTPPLQTSVARISGTQAVVSIESAHSAGPFNVVITEPDGRSHVVASQVMVRAGIVSRQTIVATAVHRLTISIELAATSVAVRSLILPAGPASVPMARTTP